MIPALTVDDLQMLAKRRLPKAIYDFFDGAAFDEATKTANREDLLSIKLRQRVLRDIAVRDHSTTILGQRSSMPVMISPVGLAGVVWPGQGEVASARAAKAVGIPFGLSMLSLASMEEIGRESGYPFWFHVMPMKDRGLLRSLLDRAVALNSPVLIVTVDWPIPAQNHRNVRNRLGQRPNARGVADLLSRPGWLSSLVRSGRKFEPGNFKGLGFSDPHVLTASLDASATWEYIEWIRQQWAGKILVKGIMHVDDAIAAFDAGADGISISNHGGVQLDHAQSSIAALAEIADRVAGRGEILIDSGVRSGHDVVKALALGARACLLGRACVYGLASGGQAGVERAIAIIREGLDSAMALTGCRTVAEINRAVLVSPSRARPAF
jgi:L-lactate dehydrogenase (cytochrome)